MVFGKRHNEMVKEKHCALHLVILDKMDTKISSALGALCFLCCCTR